MFSRFGIRLPTRGAQPTPPQAPPVQTPPTQAKWPGTTKPTPKPGPSAYLGQPGHVGPRPPKEGHIAPEKHPPMPPGPSDAALARAEKQGASRPAPEPPPMRQPAVDPSFKYTPDRERMRQQGNYVPVDRSYYLEFEKGNSQVFNTPEHSRSSGKTELTPSESAHKAMHNHMLKQESMGSPLNHETQLTSREENGRLYPNQARLMHGHESGVEPRPGMYPDGTRHNSHTHVSPYAVPNMPSTEDRMVAFEDATNGFHGPNTRMDRGIMMDKTTGKDFVYTGEIATSRQTRQEFSPYLEATDPHYNKPIPRDANLFKEGIEIPVVRKSDLPTPPPAAHLPD